MIYKIITKFPLGLMLLMFIYGFLFQKETECAVCLDVKMWTEKSEYLTRELIFVEYEIKNDRDSTLVMIFDAVKGYLVIKDKYGRGYANTLLSSYASRTDTLKPGKSYTDGERIDDRYRILSAGEYTCSIELPQDFTFPFCAEKSRSNLIKIKVKDPTGMEEKALKLYLEAQELHWCKDKDPKKWEQAFYKYLELAEKYPKSVYAPMSLYTALLKAHVINDKRIVISVCKKLIENYPDFYYIDDTFYNLVGNFKVLEDKEGATEYMNELIKEHPNTKISERAEYWLEKIEKWKFE